MGMVVGGRPKRSQDSRFRRPLNSEINVTPFVDVVLVLLIIFMVAAPLMTVGVPVDLPKTQTRPLSEKSEPVTITIQKDGQVYLMETAIDLDTLVPKLQAISQIKEKGRIYIRGDEGVPFGLIMQVMGRLNMAGFEKVGLVAALPSSAPVSLKK